MARDTSYFFVVKCVMALLMAFFFLVNRDFTKLFTNGPGDEILMSVILFPFAYSVNVIEMPPLPQSNSNANCIYALFYPISQTSSRGVASFSTSLGLADFHFHIS